MGNWDCNYKLWGTGTVTMENWDSGNYGIAMLDSSSVEERQLHDGHRKVLFIRTVFNMNPIFL